MSAEEQAIPIEATAIDDSLDAEPEQAAQEHSRTVYRIAYAVLRNSEDAEGATQEAFIRLLRARRRSKLVREPRAWLARTVWRLAVSRRQLRKARAAEFQRAKLCAPGVSSAFRRSESTPWPTGSEPSSQAPAPLQTPKPPPIYNWNCCWPGSRR